MTRAADCLDLPAPQYRPPAPLLRPHPRWLHRRLLSRKQRSARIQAEGRIEVLLGNLAQWYALALASAREQDVDLALFSLDRIEQTVEIVEIGSVAAHAGHVPANQLDGLIELLLLPTREDCNFSFKLSHNYSLWVYV
jgi:hypothetical protein